MLSRDTVEPPLTMEQLNKRVINVIPNRDIVPLIDDPGNLFQKIECRAPMNSIMGCHDLMRTFCELEFSCGSQSRQFPCFCVNHYGYPEPMKAESGSFDLDATCTEANAHAT